MFTVETIPVFLRHLTTGAHWYTPGRETTREHAPQNAYAVAATVTLPSGDVMSFSYKVVDFGLNSREPNGTVLIGKVGTKGFKVNGETVCPSSSERITHYQQDRRFSTTIRTDRSTNTMGISGGTPTFEYQFSRRITLVTDDNPDSPFTPFNYMEEGSIDGCKYSGKVECFDSKTLLVHHVEVTRARLGALSIDGDSVYYCVPMASIAEDLWQANPRFRPGKVTFSARIFPITKH